MDCLGELRDPKLVGHAPWSVIGDRLSHTILMVAIWFLGITAVLLLVSVAMALAFAVATNDSVMPGAGYLATFLGASAAVTGGFGLWQIPSRQIMRSSVVFYHTIFTPVRDAMNSSPGSYYCRSIALIASGMFTFMLGLFLIS